MKLLAVADIPQVPRALGCQGPSAAPRQRDQGTWHLMLQKLKTANSLKSNCRSSISPMRIANTSMSTRTRKGPSVPAAGPSSQDGDKGSKLQIEFRSARAILVIGQLGTGVQCLLSVGAQ